MRLFWIVPKFLKRIYFEYRLLLWGINRRIRESATISTKQGLFTISMKADDPIGKSLYCHREYEKELVTATMQLLRKVQKVPSKGLGTLLDVGANNGVISIGMLNEGEVKRAIAIEPEPRNFRLLQKNIALNGLEENFVILPYAVSDGNATLEFELSSDNFGDHRVRVDSDSGCATELYNESRREVIKVKADQLDKLLESVDENFTQNISLIWVDVQGYEAHVFRGAKRVLGTNVPVMSELWPYGMARAGVSKEMFCDMAGRYWSSYWVMRRGRFVEYPISMLGYFFDELGYDGDFENVLFTK